MGQLRAAMLLAGSSWALVFVSCLLLVVSPAAALPSAQCRMCEDAVQTFHDKYQCSGNQWHLGWGDPLSPEIKACDGPVLVCEKLTGSLRETCDGIESDMWFGKDRAQVVWDKMNNEGDHYGLCEAIGYCKDEDRYRGCKTIFDSNNFCSNNPSCKQLTVNCSQTCYVCNFLAKQHPMFQSLSGCQPARTREPPDAKLVGDKWAFLEIKRRLRAKNPKDLEQHRFREGARVESQQGGDNEPMEKMDGFTKLNKCHDLWHRIVSTPKMRYFTQWKRYVNVQADPMDRLIGAMWDPNIVCKCLGECELNRFEELGLLHACEYSEVEEEMMREMLATEGNILYDQSEDKKPQGRDQDKELFDEAPSTVPIEKQDQLVPQLSDQGYA